MLISAAAEAVAVSEDHTEDDDDGDTAPDIADNFFRAFMEKKAHICLMVQYYHMLEFYQKRSLRTVLHSPLALAIAIMICLGLARIVYDRYSIEQEMIGKRVEAEAKLHDLEVRKADLEKKVQYLSNDRGIEAEMRRNFDVARPGEQVVIILDKDTATTVDPLPKMSDEPKSAWYEFWR